jgi:hypothetical protein
VPLVELAFSQRLYCRESAIGLEVDAVGRWACGTRGRMLWQVGVKRHPVLPSDGKSSSES